MAGQQNPLTAVEVQRKSALERVVMQDSIFGVFEPRRGKVIHVRLTFGLIEPQLENRLVNLHLRPLNLNRSINSRPVLLYFSARKSCETLQTWQEDTFV